MWLAERRVVKQYQDEYLPKLQENIKNIVGATIPMEVEWDSLPLEGSANYLLEGLEKVYFLPIVEAFKAICIDEMGKSALIEGLKTIRIVNGENSPNPVSQEISFHDGVLSINQRLSNLDNDFDYRIKQITEVLEAWL